MSVFISVYCCTMFVNYRLVPILILLFLFVALVNRQMLEDDSSNMCSIRQGHCTRMLDEIHHMSKMLCNENFLAPPIQVAVRLPAASTLL
jgi:hypothetical protein